MRIEFKKKIFSGKFEKNFVSENCEKFFSRFSQGGAIIEGGAIIVWIRVVRKTCKHTQLKNYEDSTEYIIFMPSII